MARRFPQLAWQPSDIDPAALASIDAWAQETQLANLLPAIALDASAETWPVQTVDAVVCINMIHISPWQATQGLFAGSERVLAAGASLILYGPFLERDVETAPSNLAFDAELRRRDPRWGLREVEALDRLAGDRGFSRTTHHPMPANNLVLVYRKMPC